MFTLNCKGRLVVIERPVVMGILNLTPDSFYTGSRIRNTDELLHRAELMLKEGASILDIGGQSSRPGSEQLSAEEEMKRVIDPLLSLSQHFPEAIISIDSFYGSVAKTAIEAGAHIVNDISAGSLDPTMIPVVAALKVPYVLMHMKGNPKNMQQEAHYENVSREVLDYLVVKKNEIRNAGVNDIIIDPGFGFGKTIVHNFELLKHLEIFQMLGSPLMLGVSRKSMVYKTLETTAAEALNGTTVLQTIGLLKGANILRTHDIKEAMEAIRLIEAMG
jgi:dihydropteroate synthase